MKHSDNTSQFNVALCKMQFELPVIKPESKNDYFESTFADLSTIWRGIRETIHENGFSIMQGVINIPGGENQLPVLQTRLNHISGEWMEDDGVPLIMEPNKKGNKTMQAMGSAISYAKRQGLGAMIGLSISEEDDDAASASATLPSRVEPKAGKATPKVKKMTGPIKTKKGLTEACKQLVDVIKGCADTDQLSACRNSKPTNDLLKQLEADWPEAYNSERTPDSEFVGMIQRFDERGAEMQAADNG